MKRTAVLGGTFDPIHIGHLIAGQCVHDTGDFDTVCIMPSGNPPHKASTADYNEHRLHMCRLAAEAADYFTVSDIEVQREGKIYTVDTFRILEQNHPDREFWLIIGTDSLMNLETWRSPAELLAKVKFVVVDRGGYDLTTTQNQIKHLTETYGTDIRYVSMPLIELSSTNIRQRIQQDMDIRWQVPDSVYAYITENDLYKQV